MNKQRVVVSDAVEDTDNKATMDASRKLGQEHARLLSAESREMVGLGYLVQVMGGTHVVR
jgi:hypothetical protein